MNAKTVDYTAMEKALLDLERIYQAMHNTPRAMFTRLRVMRECYNIARLEYIIAQRESELSWH